MNINIYPKGDALHIGSSEVDPILLREGMAFDWDIFVIMLSSLTSHREVPADKLEPSSNVKSWH